MTESWRGRTNQILYGLIYVEELTDAVAREMAGAMAAGRYFRDGPEAYAAAVGEALAQEGSLVEQIDTPHSDEQFRAFLRRLADQLETLRP